LSAGIDYKDVQESLNPNDPLSSSVTTPVRYAPFLVQYSGAMLRQSSTTEFVTGLNFAIRGFASSDQQFENKRFNALTNYVILRWDLQHTQTLPANFVLYGRFDGQIADQPLVSNEQYFAGGLLNVPGYLEAEELGDNAYHALAELRTPSWLVLPLPAKQELRGYVYVFYAGAWLQTVQPLPSQTADSTLSSAGLGLRLNAGTWANLVLSAGWPFEATANTRAHSPRVQFIVAIQM
jgi:hemolysin activation/secretion protein